jgi:hypothetical protein
MPFETTIIPTGFSEITSRLQALGADRNFERERIINGVLTRLGQVLTRRLMYATPLGVTGSLRNTTDFRVDSTPDIVAGDTIYTLSIIQDARHAGYMYRPIVVRGRRIGRRPPAKALEAWVQLKWGVTGSEIKSAAYKLAGSIAAKGTNPNHYPKQVLDRSQDILNQAANHLGTELVVHITDI